MTKTRAISLAIAIAIAVGMLGLLLWHPWSGTSPSAALGDTPPANRAPVAGDPQPTTLYAHNLMLQKGPNFRIYVRWIQGEMVRTKPSANPTFDDPDSFVLDVQKGVIHVNIGDIGNYLNTSSLAAAPLQKISLQPAGNQVKVQGTVHKIVPLPVALLGTLSAMPDGRVRFHVDKINVLKIPLKGLLGDLHLQLADLVKANIAGIQLAGNDILFDTQKLLPPPHIRGQITSVTVNPPDLEVIYGNAPNDEAKLAKWHNFLRLSGGSLDFGKLTMRNADLTMIDISKDAWFNLDLVNYQAQLVHGFTRMTAQAGLEIFMPDVDPQAPKKLSQDISVEWLKDRTRSLPIDLSGK